jgi:hypothetical protein
MGALWFGVILGILLFIAKWGSYTLLTSKKIPKTNSFGEIMYDPVTKKPYMKIVQRRVKRWLLWGKEQDIRERINESTLLLFLIDCLGGYVGGHVLAIGGGSILAMIALSSYTIICMATIMFHFLGVHIRWPVPKPKRRYA